MNHVLIKSFKITYREISLTKKKEIEEVLEKCDDLGFDAKQDLPGNFLWVELNLASSKERVKSLPLR